MKSGLILLVGAAQSIAVSTNADCEPTGSTCPGSDCCGTVSKTGQTPLKICLAKGTTSWINPDDNGATWSVSDCPPPAAAGGANTLRSTVFSILATASIYLLA